jgi:hypothetical protein
LAAVDMTEPILSVKDFLGIPEGGLPAGFLRAGVSDEEAKSFQSKVSGALQGMQWSRLEGAVSGTLRNCLDVDPVTMFAATWEKSQALSNAAKSKSADSASVELLEHPVSRKLHPYIEIQLGPAVIRRIDFVVALSLKLKGLILKVQSGAIRGIESGTCEGSAEIFIAESSIWKHEIDPIALPGRINLGDGIRIH